MADFFEPGKTYARASSRITEVSKVFRCVAVADHPDDKQPRAFGFVAFTTPGSEWHGTTPWTLDHWAQGWAEVPAHTCPNCEGVDPQSCAFNKTEGDPR